MWGHTAYNASCDVGPGRCVGELVRRFLPSFPQPDGSRFEMAEPETPTAKGSLGLRLIAGWNRWTGASVNRSIFGAALIVAAFTVVAKLVSVAKELTVAGSFGTSDALDAYLIAFLLPSFTISVVAGSFNAALIPTFIKVRDRQGHEPAQRLLSTVMFRRESYCGRSIINSWVTFPTLSTARSRT